MKNSNQATALQRVDGVDIVSNLADPILHLILSGLPTTEETIRTSVLSRRWRYLWTSVSRVDIDYYRGLNHRDISPQNKLEEHKFTDFVNWVLLNKTLNLDSFRLCCYYYYSMSAVGRWIHAAVTRNVKQLHLVFRPTNEITQKSEVFEMPHCLLTCCSLEVLRLFLLRGRLSLPNFTGFPSLRVLELNSVELLDDDVVKSFFKSCPLLEDLSLIECLIDKLEFLCISCLKLKNLRIDNQNMLEIGEFYPCSVLQICCPKLVYLELSGPIAYNFIFESLDSLKKAIVHPHKLQHMDDTVCELFAGISHVEYLSISFSFALKCINPKVHVPVFLPNLKTLEITLDRGPVNHILQFVKCFPNLDSLHLNIIWFAFTRESWKLKEAATKEIFARLLKKVVFVEFSNGSVILYRVCFFLKHVKALEEMVFIWRNEAKFNEMLTEAMNEISNFHKASLNVKLISLLKPYRKGSTYFSEV